MTLSEMVGVVSCYGNNDTQPLWFVTGIEKTFRENLQRIREHMAEQSEHIQQLQNTNPQGTALDTLVIFCILLHTSLSPVADEGEGGSDKVEALQHKLSDYRDIIGRQEEMLQASLSLSLPSHQLGVRAVCMHAWVCVVWEYECVWRYKGATRILEWHGVRSSLTQKEERRVVFMGLKVCVYDEVCAGHVRVYGT